MFNMEMFIALRVFLHENQTVKIKHRTDTVRSTCEFKQGFMHAGLGLGVVSPIFKPSTIDCANLAKIETPSGEPEDGIHVFSMMS